MYRKKLMQACLAGALVATIGTSANVPVVKAAAETQAIDVAESNVEDSEVEEETEEVEETSEEEAEEVEETSEEETEEAEETSEEETEEVAEETVETLSVDEETDSVETNSATVTVNVTFLCDGISVGSGAYSVPAGVQKYYVLEQYVPAGYQMTSSGDFWAAAGEDIEVNVEKISTDVTMNIQFKDGDEVVAGGDYSVPAGVQNYSVLAQYVPEGYQMTVGGDFTAAEGARLVVNVEKISTDVTMNIQFKDGDKVVAGGDYTVPEGVQNYSVLEQYVPAGYKMTVSGDFTAAEGAHLEVSVEKISTDVTMNIQFKDGDEVVAGGDYTVPEGVQNYSVLEQYVPEGYQMTVSGDFTATEGAHLEVSVEKITADVVMNIQFKDGDKVVAGGDYVVPAGVQNYSVLEKYVPEGYQMTVSGDFTAAAGAHLEVSVEKTTADVTMNIQFKDGDEVVAGGDYTVPAGVQNYSVLEQYVPAGYQMTVSGDFMAEAGAHLEVAIEKITTDVIMNIQFKDGDEVIAGGDYSVPAGIQNYSVLEKYVPAGYQMTVSGDFMAEAGTHLDVAIEKVQKNVIMNVRFVDENGEFIAGGDYTLPEGVQNRSILEQYVPAGYEMTETGDFMVEEGGKLDVTVKKVATDVIMNICFVDADGNVIAGGDYFLPEGVQNYSVLEKYLPENYKLAVSGDFMVTEGGKETVRVEKIADEQTEIIMNIQFKDGDEVVAGGDYFVPEGVQNYAVLQKYVPAGYQMTVSGDFMAEEGGKLVVSVEKVQKDVIMNVIFTYDGETVVGGDYFLPEGVQNYSILSQYVPEGYEMRVSGDFFVEEGGKLEVPLEKVQKDVIMNVIFTYDGETVVGGDFFLPEGVQNYSILEQYVPEGYEMRVSGDFFVEEGGKLEVPLEKVQKDVIMNVRFMYNDEFVAGGDFFLPEGVQNYSILEQYVPDGYKMRVSGDFFVEEGGKLEVPLEKIDNTIIMNIAFICDGEVIAGGDYFVPEGIQNYQVLQQYVPEGYEMTVSGDFFAIEGTHLDVNIQKIGEESTETKLTITFETLEGTVVGTTVLTPAEEGEHGELCTFVVGEDFQLPEGYQLAEGVVQDTEIQIPYGSVGGHTVLVEAIEADQPEDPDQPDDPDQPTDPSQPVDPSQPTDPGQTVNPGQSGNQGQTNTGNNTNTVQKTETTNTVSSTQTTEKKAPKTADTTNTAAPVAGLLGSMAVIGALLRKKVRR